VSAFNVNKDTIDLLVSAWYWTGDGHYMPELHTQARPRTKELAAFMDSREPYLSMRRTDSAAKLNALGVELVAENAASVNARYKENNPPMNYTYERIERMENWQAVVLGAIHCYEYQACEHSEWLDSLAYAYCQALRRNICTIIGANHWEFNRELVSV
jgi:hypothetical protein